MYFVTDFLVSVHRVQSKYKLLYPLS